MLSLSLLSNSRALANVRFQSTSPRVTIDLEKKHSTKELIEMESKYCANNYHPIPVVFEKAKGVEVWDPEGKKYFDFLAAYSAVNQGHSHPRLLEVMRKQSEKLGLSARAFHNNQLPLFAKFVTSFFSFDKVLPSNGGVEAVEGALKIARKWGYEKKGIPQGQAKIITASGNFHGRTLGVISFSDDPDSYTGFGPTLEGFIEVPYNDLNALEKLLEQHGSTVAGFLFEPVQGEAGVVVPDHGYLKGVHDLCKQHNVLVIDDEIQAGLCRTGRMLAADWEYMRPDILILGKALSGGIYPVSAVLADDDVMEVLTPGTHGSTYGGNPLGTAVSIEALKILEDEKLAENSDRLGERFRSDLAGFQEKFPFIKIVRGKGLFNAMVIDKEYKKSAWDLCMILKDNGLLAKPTHDHIIRFSPPLVITDEQLAQCTSIIEDSLRQFAEE